MADMQITTAKVSDLLPYANNAREHTDEQVAQVAASIQEFGWTNPIITHGQTVVAGHARLAAARKLNLEEVPIIDRSDMSEAQWKAYVLADNQLAQNATWNEGLLTLELDSLADLDFNLDLLGFDDLDALMGNDEPEEGLTDPDEIPDAPEEAITQPGDLWILGDHRLLCGDSTDAESVAYLMDGAKADMVFTDPPYNVDFQGTMSSTSLNGVIQPFNTENTKHHSIANDDMDSDGFHSLVTGLAGLIKAHCSGAYYVTFTSSAIQELLIPLLDSGLEYKSIICWVKNQSPMGGGAYRRRYEPIVYGNISGDFYGKPYAEDDVWEFDRTNKNDLHPTMKPIALIENALSHGSKGNGFVLDPFLGSGTTLIAAERLGRKCYGIEIDPIYCDVIVKRWEDFTGKKAERHGG